MSDVNSKAKPNESTGAKQLWIKTTDQEPPYNSTILVATQDGGIYVADKMVRYTLHGAWAVLEKVTHWQRLPEGPKEEG